MKGFHLAGRQRYRKPPDLPTMGWLGMVCCLLLLTTGPAWSEPQETASDSVRLEEIVSRAEALPRLHSLLVAHRGEPIIEYAATGIRLDQPANIKSLSKTIISAIVGIAIERGIFDGTNQPITELLGEHVPANATSGIDNITVGYLLSMQAGLEHTSGRHYSAWVASGNWIDYVLTRPFVAQPGGRMLYSTGNTHLLSAALTWQTGSSTLELARDWLGDPLEISIPPWTKDPQGIYMGGNEMALSPQALLAFGEMYRTRGIVNGERIVPTEWIEASWTPRTRSIFNFDQYGYGWFITQLAEEDVYYGWGFAGQMLYVIPGLELTVVMTSDPSPPSPGRSYLNELEGMVAEIVIPSFQKGSHPDA